METPESGLQTCMWIVRNDCFVSYSTTLYKLQILYRVKDGNMVTYLLLCDDPLSITGSRKND